MQYGTQGNVPGAGVQKPWTPAEYFPGTTTFINKLKRRKQSSFILFYIFKKCTISPISQNL